MKKQNTNPEVQATATESMNTNNQATKVTTKKEEKKMTSTKKSETAKTATPTITIPENLNQDMFKAYKMNETGELLMTEDMLKEFLEANTELKATASKADPTKKGIKVGAKGKVFAVVRITEDAKKKQVHIHTGATKKVVSARDEKSGIRYKVIFRDKTQKFELWSADGAGKRKMVKRGTEEEVMAEYNRVLGIEATPEVKKATRKATKKSA